MLPTWHSTTARGRPLSAERVGRWIFQNNKCDQPFTEAVTSCHCCCPIPLQAEAGFCGLRTSPSAIHLFPFPSRSGAAAHRLKRRVRHEDCRRVRPAGMCPVGGAILFSCKRRSAGRAQQAGARAQAECETGISQYCRRAGGKISARRRCTAPIRGSKRAGPQKRPSSMPIWLCAVTSAVP